MPGHNDDARSAGPIQRGIPRSLRAGRWLWALAAIAVVVGVACRLTNIGRKPYWHDEAYTSMRIAGYTIAQVHGEVYDGREIGIRDLQRYQRMPPGAAVAGAVRSLAAEDLHQPPLYFVAVHLWARFFGDSPAAVRTLSVLFALAVLPGMYWLGLELFDSRSIARVMTALAAVSPFNLLYAQEARSYSLWMLISILSTATLLRCVRQSSRWLWWTYALAIGVGMYVHTFFAIVVIAHAGYMLAGRRSVRLAPWACSVAAGLAMFAPWAILAALRFDKITIATGWATTRRPPADLFIAWTQGLSSVFFDTSDFMSEAIGRSVPAFVINSIRLGIVGLTAFSVYHLWRQGPRRASVMVLALIAAAVAVLSVPDLLQGGMRSAVSRFWTPFYLATQVAAAYLAASLMGSRRRAGRVIGQGMIIALLAAGTYSCVTIVRAESWWNKDDSRDTAALARILTRADHPLLLSDDTDGTTLGRLLSLSHVLDPKVRLQLVVGPRMFELPADQRDVFLLAVSEARKRDLRQRQNRQMELVYPPRDLWRVGGK